MVQFDAAKLKKYLSQVFIAWGVDENDAPFVADSYVTANLFGLASHGVMRIMRILDGVKAGTHFPANRHKIIKETESMALLDGNSALGVAVGYNAMKIAVEKAKKTGIGCVGVHNSNHFGTAGYYVRLAAKEGMVGFCFCNAAPGVAAPTGTKKVLGTNPIAIGAPTRGDPFALDMSIAAVVRGKALEFERTGKQLPEGVAIDKDGKPTTDPTTALAGAFLPYGGVQSYKTFGLALMIDVLCGPLVGAMFGDKVRGSANTKEDCTKGDFYIAIDVSKFRDFEQYLDDMEELKGIVKKSGENIFMPGEIEHSRAAKADNTIELDDDMAEQIMSLGKEHGIEYGK